MSAATRRGRVLRGLGISPGVALGPIYFFENDIGEVPRLKLAAGAVEREVSRLRKAFAEA